jgi:hypothetical protein
MKRFTAFLVEKRFDGWQSITLFHMLEENAFAPVRLASLRKTCTLCRKESNLKCSKCGISYCSALCQKGDWAIHKSECAQLASIKKETFVYTPAMKKHYQKSRK